MLIALKAGYSGRLSARRQSATVFVLPPGQFPLKKKELFVYPEFRVAVKAHCPPSLILTKRRKQLQNSSERSAYGLSDAVSEWIVQLFQER